jgi:long-subunit fatty acid transport protein
MFSYKKLIIGFIIIAGVNISDSLAQSGYFEDALRFSHFRSTGSARITGMGGTQMSLGGDVSNIHGNPAGLGFFRRSEFSISPTFTNWISETNYLDQILAERTGNIAVPNLSIVLSKVRNPLLSGSFKGGSFGLSFNRTANFNNQFGFFSDIEGNSSIIDFFLQDASGIPENQIENFGLTGLAYQSYLINPVAFDEDGNPINNPSEYDSFVLGFPFQDETVITEGGINQTSFSYGANFNNKLFLGASLGITSITFSSSKTYNEEFFEEPLQNLSIQENLRINGIGANVNVGVIYKPIDIINLGLNFQSPTWYRLNEEYEARMVNMYNNYDFEEEDVVLGREEASTSLILGTYNLNTPLRVSGGLTYFIGKNGFISADVDYLDYSSSRLSSNDFNPSADNLEIQARYGTTLNFRVGGEFRYEIFRARAGYALYGDPFVNSDFDRSSQQITGGVGVKMRNFYVDLGISNLAYNQLYRSYSYIENGANVGPVSEINNTITSGTLTVGFNF